jgi:hypothetical protein
MKELHEKKKPASYVEQEKPQSSKLNLNNMIEKKAEKKPEGEKKSFNSLSMKLVKPAEKKSKPVGPASKPSQPAGNKPAQKESVSVNLFDELDLGVGEASSQPQQPQQTQDLDFLLGGPTQPQSQQSQPASNSFDLFGQSVSAPASNSAPQSQPTQPYQNFSLPVTQPPPPQQSFTLSYQQPVHQPPQNYNLSQGFDFLGGPSSGGSFNSNQPNGKAAPSFSLATGQEVLIP